MHELLSSNNHIGNIRDLITTYSLYAKLREIGSTNFISQYCQEIKSSFDQFAKSSPLAEIVVPVFNETNYLPACLAALSRQTVPIRVIIVDNGSTDESVGIASTLGAHEVIYESIRGIGSAKKAGILHSSLSHILITDADTAPVNTWVENMISNLDRDTDLCAVYSPALYHDANSPGLVIYNLLAISGRFFRSAINRPHYQGNNCILAEPVRGWLAEDDNPQAGDDGRLDRVIKTRGGKTKWIWDSKSLVFTSSRRIKANGLFNVFIRRTIHLLTGHSDIAYYPLYAVDERGDQKNNY